MALLRASEGRLRLCWVFQLPFPPPGARATLYLVLQVSGFGGLVDTLQCVYIFLCVFLTVRD